MRLSLCMLLIVAATASGCLARRDAATPAAGAAVRLPDVELPVEFHVVAARVSAGATLASVLRANRVAEREVAEVVARAASVFDLRKVRTAQPYRIEQGTDGAVRRFEYEIDGDRFLRVMRSSPPSAEDASPRRAEEASARRARLEPSGFVAEVMPIEKTRALAIVRGAIDRAAPSLFAAMDAAGESVDLSVSLAEIFSGEIDFNIDLQPGDRFELLVEKQYRDNHVFAGYGPILAAEFDNAGHKLRAVRFTPQGGAPGYYDERGVSMRRFFLQSPLKFVPVVSSGFSRSRLHPILREYRPHLGVDYRAPSGAPVIAVADGIVVEAGANGGAGRMVHLRHANGFESEYLHLSSIAVRVGARVRQGELVGRVGATGLATGPHLDYRLKKNGVFINPLTAHRSMPPGEPVPAPQIVAFHTARDRAFAELTSPAVTQASAPVTDHQQ